jgi:hypothetical protein
MRYIATLLIPLVILSTFPAHPYIHGDKFKKDFLK